MAKLFASEELDIEQPSAPEKLIEAKIENSDIPDIVEFHEDAIQVAVEGVARASNELYILRDVKASIESKKLSSVEYFTSMENYSLYMKSVANNLGVRAKIPSMEDFKNPYGVETSHKIAMEGFMEFMRSIWEKIKSFFKDFFKRVMLFFKRLVNANLQMEEYEMYIEDLMHKVKRSDKNSVTQIKVDSKLPSLLGTPDIETMRSDYLITKGKQKLSNLSTFIKVFTGEIDKNFHPGFTAEMNSLISKLKDKSVVLTASDVDNIRHRLADTFQTLFTNSVHFNNLPDDVQNDIMNAFDSSEIKGSSFFSAIPDKNPNQMLPRDFNIYHVKCDFAVSETSNSSKVLITSNSERNNITENNLETISSRENLLRLYDFYKDFSKTVKIEQVQKTVEKFDKEIDRLTTTIRDPFTIATENVMPTEDDPFPVTATDEDESSSTISASQANDMLGAAGFTRRPNLDEPELDFGNSGNNDKPTRHSKEVIDKLEDLHKFIINYLNVIQVLLKEVSVGLMGIHQECRYEMIKYLYKCAKQF
jgi:hypothetical protein